MKYFLFDIGNVLVDFNAQDFLAKMAHDAGKTVEPLTDLDFDMIAAVEKGSLSDQEFVDYLNRTHGISWTVDDLIATWSSMFSIHTIGHGLFEDAVKAGLRVYTLSNIAQHHVAAIEQNWSGFFDQATGLFMSYQMGTRKPELEIYRMVLKQLNAEGGQCFFLDDRLENVEAAREAGFQAYHFIEENHEPIRAAAEKFFQLK